MDPEIAKLLEWAMARRQLWWPAYRNVGGQVCKRLRRRIAALGLPDVAAYRERLETDPAEWLAFDALSVITISRFYRDRRVWEALRAEVLPELAAAAAAAGEPLCSWSVGCASGEEPYTLSLAWWLELAKRYPSVGWRVLASDVEEAVLARARAGRYAPATLRELPAAWREQAFARAGSELVLEERFRRGVELCQQDVRMALPEGRFRLILCRNSVLSYFAPELQREVLERVLTRLVPGGALLIAPRERLPAGTPLTPWRPELGIYRLPARARS